MLPGAEFEMNDLHSRAIYKLRAKLTLAFAICLTDLTDVVYSTWLDIVAMPMFSLAEDLLRQGKRDPL